MKITVERIKQYNSTTKRVIFADGKPICIVKGPKRESSIISYLSGYNTSISDLSIKRKLDRVIDEYKHRKPKFIIMAYDENHNILEKVNVSTSYTDAMFIMSRMYNNKLKSLCPEQIYSHNQEANKATISYKDGIITYIIFTDAKIYKEKNIDE